jgi:hypothetical protein
VAAGFLTRSQIEERVRSLARPGSGAQSWSLRIPLCLTAFGVSCTQPPLGHDWGFDDKGLVGRTTTNRHAEIETARGRQRPIRFWRR